jgi:argininosuccinate synthase
LLNYAANHGIPVKSTLKKPYSEDDNLLHISHEAGILEDPAYKCEHDIISKIKMPQDAPDKETHISITFKDGIAIKGNQPG